MKCTVCGFWTVDWLSVKKTSCSSRVEIYHRIINPTSHFITSSIINAKSSQLISYLRIGITRRSVINTVISAQDANAVKCMMVEYAFAIGLTWDSRFGILLHLRLVERLLWNAFWFVPRASSKRHLIANWAYLLFSFTRNDSHSQKHGGFIEKSLRHFRAIPLSHASQ